MRCRTQRVRQEYSCPDAIFDGYTSSTATAVPLPLEGKAFWGLRAGVETSPYGLLVNLGEWEILYSAAVMYKADYFTA
jgi:hypothetical protein